MPERQKPRAGAVVQYFPADHPKDKPPLAAQITTWRADDEVSLDFTDDTGSIQRANNVKLIHPLDGKPEGAHAMWPPRRDVASEAALLSKDKRATEGQPQRGSSERQDSRTLPTTEHVSADKTEDEKTKDAVKGDKSKSEERRHAAKGPDPSLKKK